MFFYIKNLDTEHIIYGMNTLFMFSNFLFIFLSSFRIHPKKRLFHYLLSHISIVSAISYLMLCNDIFTFMVGHKKIYNARYFDWIVNTPVQLIIIGKIGKLTDANIYILVLLDIIMILMGWIAELCENQIKWIFFSIGMIVIFPIYKFLFEDFNFHVVKEFTGDYIATKYYWVGRYLIFLWLFYPIVWILNNVQFNIISNLTACICYTVLDFLAKVVFVWWIWYCIHHSIYIKTESECSRISDV